MRFRSTIILAVLFSVLAGYLYFVERHREVNDDKGLPLLDFKTDSIDYIELRHPGREVVVQKKGGRWRMIKPVDARADERSVANLIETLADARSTRELEGIENLASYGLDIPSATIILRAQGVPLAPVKIGKNNPLGTQAYVQRADEPAVLLTDASFASRTNKKAADLRDKQILSFDIAEVSTLQILPRVGDAVVLERNDGVWKQRGATDENIDQASVHAYLTELGSIRANDFVSEEPRDLKRYGLHKPSLLVHIKLPNEQLTLRVGSEREGKVRVQNSRRQTVYSLASWAGDRLPKDIGYFRVKTPASESTATPIPNAGTDNGVDDNALNDTATAGE